MNSSPPTRYAVSRAAARARIAASTQQALVAGLVTEPVVDGLEVFEIVTEQERECMLVARHGLAARGRGAWKGRGGLRSPGGSGSAMAISARALDLGRAGGVEAAAVAHDEAREGEQQQPHRDDDPVMVRLGARLVAAQGGALGERTRARGAGLAVDDVGEDAEERDRSTCGRRP